MTMSHVLITTITALIIAVSVIGGAAYQLFLSMLFLLSFWLIITLALNIQAGYLGLPQFGVSMFLIIGSYFSGTVLSYLTTYLASGTLYNPCLPPSNPTNLGLSIILFTAFLVATGAVGAAVGFLISYPAARLRADYLGVTLIVAGEIVRSITYSSPVICPYTYAVNMPNLFSWAGDNWFSAFVTSSLIIALVIYVLVERLTNSPFGRRLRAVRDSEIAAAVYGKNVVRTKLITLMIGGALMSIAGYLLAFYGLSTDVRQFTPIWTFNAWLMMVLGGSGNNLGSLVGVGIYLLIDLLLKIIKIQLGVSYIYGIDPEYIRYMALGIILMVILQRAPQGLVPERHMVMTKPIKELLTREARVRS